MTEKERLLTTPEVLHGWQPFLPTGNDAVSVPTLRPRDAALERIGMLHLGCAGLLEVCGSTRAGKVPGQTPLLQPVLRQAGLEQPLSGLTWVRLGEWVPRFTWRSPDEALELQGTICAPLDERGLVYLLVLENRSSAAVDCELGWRGEWGDTLQTVFTSGRLEGVQRARLDRWTNGPVFELRTGAALLGWALLASSWLNVCHCDDGDDELSGERELSVWGERPLKYQLRRAVRLEPGQRSELALYLAVGREGDGARCAAIHLARVGHPQLIGRTVEELARRRVKLPRAPEPDRERLEQLASLNLHFNRYFALGRSLDGDELVPVTSRSPLYYVSAAFWSRDSLLWSLPGLLCEEPRLGRELLLNVFRRHRRQAGVHALYIDGGVLYPGFELDELCAFVIGLHSYVDATGDLDLVKAPEIQQGLLDVEAELQRRKHPRHWLFETFLYPSDDPAVAPYLTYDNALVARALELLDGWEARGLIPPRPGQPGRRREESARVRLSVRKYFTVTGPFGPMFAWCSDLADPPQHTLYDEPPGSLQLLPYYGLCAADDPVWENTVHWIHSEHNPHSYAQAPLGLPGCPHAEHPFVMSIFNALLGGRASRAEKVLLRAKLDGGLACESFDGATGEVRTGAAFATCAGFLGHALVKAFG